MNIFIFIALKKIAKICQYEIGYIADTQFVLQDQALAYANTTASAQKPVEVFEKHDA